MRTKQSLYDRMNKVDYNPPAVECPVRGHISRVSKLDEKTRRVVTQLEYQKIDNASNLNKYHVNDFSLENLIAVGAPLRPCQFQQSRFQALSQFDRVLDTPNQSAPAINDNSNHKTE